MISAAVRTTALARLLVLGGTIMLGGCIPPPADIGMDYSGPLHRVDPTAPPVVPRVAATPPVTMAPDCEPVIESPTRKRSVCGIEFTMARYNGGLQTLYQRRLAERPALIGNVVLNMMIAPDGHVQACDIASTELDDPEFMRQITSYVRTISFGAQENIPSWSDTYTLTFTPQTGTVPPKTVPPKTVPPKTALPENVLPETTVPGTAPAKTGTTK